MKFIYYSDGGIPSNEVLSDCDHSLFVVVNTENELMKQADLEVVLLVVLNKAPSQEFIEWHKKNSDIKLILFTKELSEAYVRDLQNEHSFYDLFYKYPISYFEVEKNIKLISPFTNSMWRVNKDELEGKSTKLDLSVDDNISDNSEIGIGSIADDVGSDEGKKNDGPLLSELELPPSQNVENKSMDLGQDLSDVEAVLGLTSEVQLEDVNVNSPTDTEISNEEGLLKENLSLDGAKESSLDLTETDELLKGLLKEEAKDNTEDASLLSLESLNPPLPESMPKLQESELQLSGTTSEVKEDVPQNTPIANVTLNEVLESKEDQIFRLMSKNKLLSDEILEKEELIKKIHKDLKEMQAKYDQNLRIVEEHAFQVSVLKNSHEQDIQEGKKKLEVANAKIVLLENRVEELKRVPSLPKSNEAVLSIGELRKIKARQEQLEEKISLIQSDSAIQLQHREKKIVDLKRKIDLLEFDLKDSLERESEMKKKIQIAESKITQMKQILKQVVDESGSIENKEVTKKTGTYDV